MILLALFFRAWTNARRQAIFWKYGRKNWDRIIHFVVTRHIICINIFFGDKVIHNVMHARNTSLAWLHINRSSALQSLPFCSIDRKKLAPKSFKEFIPSPSKILPTTWGKWHLSWNLMSYFFKQNHKDPSLSYCWQSYHVSDDCFAPNMKIHSRICPRSLQMQGLCWFCFLGAKEESDGEDLARVQPLIMAVFGWLVVFSCLHTFTNFTLFIRSKRGSSSVCCPCNSSFP